MLFATKRKIYEIRGYKVMLDSDLAELYNVETKNLKRAVRANIERFPDDFMFELTKEEYESLRCKYFTSNKKMTQNALGPKGRFYQAKRLKETTPLRHSVNIRRV